MDYLELILENFRKFADGTGTSSVSDQINRIMNRLERELVTRSKYYKYPTSRHMFMMNNWRYIERRAEKPRIKNKRMTQRIFNVKNPFNVKGKNQKTKSIDISTIKSRITMTLSIQENIFTHRPIRMIYNFSQLSSSTVKTRIIFLTITLALFLFGCDEMRYSNSS